MEVDRSVLSQNLSRKLEIEAEYIKVYQSLNMTSLENQKLKSSISSLVREIADLKAIVATHDNAIYSTPLPLPTSSPPPQSSAPTPPPVSPPPPKSPEPVPLLVSQQLPSPPPTSVPTSSPKSTQPGIAAPHLPQDRRHQNRRLSNRKHKPVSALPATSRAATSSVVPPGSTTKLGSLMKSSFFGCGTASSPPSSAPTPSQHFGGKQQFRSQGKFCCYAIPRQSIGEPLKPPR